MARGGEPAFGLLSPAQDLFPLCSLPLLFTRRNLPSVLLGRLGINFSSLSSPFAPSSSLPPPPPRPSSPSS